MEPSWKTYRRSKKDEDIARPVFGEFFSCAVISLGGILDLKRNKILCEH